ncbi:gamma-tubulin complex component 6 isoform X8 [Lagenorhynchus albirostris]|uniref:gamma-tubulin complex component 6 isoform X8 n=1 Tax=Lagenorhynchus albirostris TaxID=27610 RepID=UPI0028E4010E|nr:gamma-tubulin complex component 6 isoform X8 [Lagenorhynchus albirostris]
MASVPQLVDDLCEALLPAAKAHSGQRRGSRKKAKQSLKRVAYNVLFTSLFQDETRKLQPGLPRLPVKNRILMLSFDLRVSGLGAEADRLEELVEELEAAHRRPLAELGSVLDLLVRLAGSGPPRMLRRRRDFFLHSRPVGRDVPYGGYDCADLSGLEADVRSLISGEEYLCRDLVRKTLQVMEAAPGTGLPAVGLFSYGDPCGDRFERDTRVSLFGALVHSRTADLDVRLDLPPVPDSADLSGLAIKVSSSVDQSEDEGFQSASNLTPDSQSEPGMTPDIDLWDAVLTYEASKRRCWEQVGCPPGHREEPYLTEAGRAAFDRSCRLCQAGLQVLGGGLLQAPQPVLVKECELVKDALNILIGVVSATFSLCQHYLCCSDVPVPRVSVIFSLEELKDIEKDCAIYVGRMERVARHSSISKEEKELRMEIAKQELIVQAREAASRVLSALSDRQLSERMALDAQKREQFQRLKEQFVKDQERRRAARQEELDDDFSYARELRDRQRRLKALEEQLERKARQALVDHYSKLSAEAARREQKALWKVQRHRLAGARLRFLLEDQKRVQELLEDMAEGKPLEPLAILPGARFQASFLGPEHPDGGGSCDPGHEGWHEAARDSPDRQSVLTPQPLEPPAAGACGSGPGAGPPSEQAEGPGPFSVGLSIRDFLPTAQRAEQPVLTSAAPVLDEALQTIGSDLPPLAPSAAADTGPSGPQEYDFRTILRPSVAAPASPGALQTAGGSLGSEGPRLREDTHVQLDTCVPDGRVALPYAHPPQHPSCQEESSQDPGQLCGQVAEPGVPTEGYASGMAPARPRWNVHGHVSDANIRVGENVWDVAPSRPRWNVHGHVSDASIRVGENVWDVAPSRPRWNVHGHVSQSSVMLGLLSGEAEPNVPGPPWAPPDHGSRSGLSLGAQSPAREDEPRLPAETASGGSGRGEETGLQDLLSAEAAPTALEDSIPEEPGPGASGDSQDLSPSGPPSSQVRADGVRGWGPGVGAACAAGGPPAPAWPVVGSEGSALGLGSTRGMPPAQSVLSHSRGTGGLLEAGLSQEGVDTRSSPGPGEEAAQRWDREQAYLAGLAGQYCLERYPDSYEAMSEPPVARLLHHGLPRAFALPEDPGAQSDADASAVQLSELLPLPVLMKHSITAPLAAHVSLVNKAAVDYFFVELHLGAHFEALRHFLLMEDGEFAQSLSDLLFEKLGAGQTPGELLSPLVLNSVLSKALQYSLHGDTPHAANLSFALKFLPETFAPNAPDVLSCLELRYKVDWPLNIVVTEGCLSRYSGIFSFLLQLKLMMWTLKDVCFHLKRTARVSHAAGSVQFRQLQLFKHEMQHFVKVIQGYIANQILHVTWCEFQARLASVGDLEEIQRAHAEYLHKAVFRGLLTEKAAPVMNIIHSTFSLVLKFRSQLIAQPWRGPEHPNFALLQQSYSTFKYYSHFLFKVVSKLVNRGYQPHLEDFLLRINFNSYYQDA